MPTRWNNLIPLTLTKAQPTMTLLLLVAASMALALLEMQQAEVNVCVYATPEILAAAHLQHPLSLSTADYAT
jgi:hypothetical protein